MLCCQMGKSSCDRDKQAMAPGEQNARAGVKTLVNFRFVIVFSLIVCFFESCRCIYLSDHRMLIFP